ncbi:hypothetical protein FACS189451_04090 [Bacteroidia bacterium]|nr:hypothetical protein FACS189446_1890 [Bacteroidia bacterium]GHT61633.1 hypothetical protein FACS189451_04090 [Bacteroidia bacterium]
MKKAEDGQRFTLRLSDEDHNALSKLQQITGETTETKIIKYLINNFSPLNERYLHEIRKSGEMEQELRSIKLKLKKYFSAWEDLNNIKL